MASIINASNTSGLTFTSDMSGVLQLQQNGVALPALSVAPAFYAYRGSSDQSLSSNTFTKIQYNTEIFDTASCFDSTTNYRFTPTVAGYYQFNAAMYVQGASISRMLISIYKNGSEYIRAADINTAGNVAGGSGLIYMNGSTDYVEVYAYITATSPSIGAGSTYSYFQGFLARGA